MEIVVNYWAVLAAGVSSMVVGSIWYARGVFGNTWAKIAHVDLDKKMSSGDMVKMFGTVFLASLVTAAVLAHVAYMVHVFMDNSFLQDAVTAAFWLWLAFTAGRILTHDIFEGRPFKLSLLTFGNEFVTILVMGVIIGVIGV